MLKRVAVVIGLLVAIVLVMAAFRPDSFRVERSIVVNAPPEKVFALINDFRQWQQWSPWEHIDPNLKRSYSGAASGVGSAYAWEGNDQVGSGRMQIMESTLSSMASRIRIQLDFLKPFEAHNEAEFTLQAEGGNTRVSWVMQGPSPYLTKLIGLVFSMDAMVGKDFEKGLGNLKSVAEKS